MNQFVLDAYAARSCPVKTFNAFDPVLRGPAQPLDESLRESFQGGSDFRRGVLDRIAATPGAVDLRGQHEAGLPWEEREAACLTAMGSGAPVILGGVLPLDLDGHRTKRREHFTGPVDAGGDRRTDGVGDLEVDRHVTARIDLHASLLSALGN